MGVGAQFYRVAGALCLRHAVVSVSILAAIIGVTWLVVGVMEIFTSFHREVRGWYRAAAIILGIVSILGALVVLIWPTISLLTLVWLSGIWLVVLGATQVVMAITTGRSVQRSPEARYHPRPA